jgi:hypothetical protein
MQGPPLVVKLMARAVLLIHDGVFEFVPDETISILFSSIIPLLPMPPNYQSPAQSRVCEPDAPYDP